MDEFDGARERLVGLPIGLFEFDPQSPSHLLDFGGRDLSLVRLDDLADVLLEYLLWHSRLVLEPLGRFLLDPQIGIGGWVFLR
jgi:hypothetical protein